VIVHFMINKRIMYSWWVIYARAWLTGMVIEHNGDSVNAMNLLRQIIQYTGLLASNIRVNSRI
jgi:hypothetical protein